MTRICPGENPIYQPSLEPIKDGVGGGWAVNEEQSFHRDLKYWVTKLSKEYLCFEMTMRKSYLYQRGLGGFLN